MNALKNNLNQNIAGFLCTSFITFYIPCLATLVAMTKEIGYKLTVLAATYSLALATLLGLAARFLAKAARLS